jgi:hypothetical protein
MGLHLNYEFRLPATTAEHAVDAILAELRACAFERCAMGTSEMLDASVPGPIRFFASLIARPCEDEMPAMYGDVRTARGFYINPGEGCETATFGFLRRADEGATSSEWYWHCSCKTQYASVVSDEHLVVCHTLLVGVLDRAVALAVAVDVRDETQYWETRDESRLIAEVHAMNRLVARFAGAVSDALGESHRAEAPIFSHRHFERLEMGEDE